MVDFQIIRQDTGSEARQGVLTTFHGSVETPVFMPVGTAGAVKGITPKQLEQTGTEVVLANTYHLLLRPGIETIEKLGGLHKFMGWNHTIVTDSGGYQVFSLGALNRMDDEGVEFASHIDGARIYLTAQSVIDAQNRLGADIIMCLDQCTPFPVDADELKKAVQRTILWAKLTKQSHRNGSQPQQSEAGGQLLFAIVQGGIDLELRSYCASELAKLDFDGYAIGGLSVGEGHDNMVKTVTHTAQLLPAAKPRYLMGVGTPADIIAAVRAGVDMFDCVLPTRNGRNAFAFTENGPVRLRNNAHINSIEPIEPGCDCYCCKNFSRGTIRHLFNSEEMLGPILASLHNLRFYQRLMAKIRQMLREGRFTEWAEEQIRKYRPFTIAKDDNRMAKS
jgi:queuine tRNA-ribosyltransferase